MGLKRYLSNLFRHDRNTKRLIEGLKLDIQNAQVSLLEKVATKEFVRSQYLQDKVLNSNEMGVTSIMFCEHEVVVSLTTHSIRIHDVFLSIESIMQGTIKPNRIVLWLAEDEFIGKSLPITLQKQVARGLEISYCKDIRSYKKLIPTIQKYPNSIVVTIDDDAMYDVDFLEKLINSHKSNPNVVFSNRIHRMKLDESNMPISYMDWDWCVNKYDDSQLNFLVGVGGVLYPPHIFSDEVLNEDVFMDICKYADDVWFNAMLLLNKIKVAKSYTKSLRGDDFVDIESGRSVSLCHENANNEKCRNDVQIKAVWEKYKINKLIE